MRKVNKLRTSFIPPSHEYRHYNDDDDNAVLDIVSPSDRPGIENRLKEIENTIEDIGKICDIKKQKSFEDYNNVLKSNKSQFLDELTKLKLKLMESIKQNTREDFLHKLKRELNTIKNQVYDKDKELQGNNKTLYKLENKYNLIKEERNFLNKEIKNAKQYNHYLQSRLKELENASTVIKDVSYINTSMIVNKVSLSPPNEKEVAKLDAFFKQNENLLVNKINQEEKTLNDKISKYKLHQTFDNPILNVLKNKVKEYELNLINGKISNQEIFFNNSCENDLNGSKSTRKVN